MSQHSKEDIVIIIPAYKEDISPSEVVSLRQACSILNKYSIVIVCPENLNIENYSNIAKEVGIELKHEFFAENFFKGIEGYNKLMLSPLFYKRFSQYKYMLIYQLDCYVFKDELLQWINKNYDYIGAPWIFNDYRGWTFNQKLKYWIKRNISRYTNSANSIMTTYYKVGNGGFSLRKIKSFLNILEKYESSPRLEKYKQEDIPVLNEDVFWSREVNRYYPVLKIPGYRTGLKFAFDVNPELCYELNNNTLPFGCHAWQRYNLSFWEKFIDTANLK